MDGLVAGQQVVAPVDRSHFQAALIHFVNAVWRRPSATRLAAPEDAGKTRQPVAKLATTVLPHFPK